MPTSRPNRLFEGGRRWFQNGKATLSSIDSTLERTWTVCSPSNLVAPTACRWGEGLDGRAQWAAHFGRRASDVERRQSWRGPFKHWSWRRGGVDAGHLQHRPRTSQPRFLATWTCFDCTTPACRSRAGSPACSCAQKRALPPSPPPWALGSVDSRRRLSPLSRSPHSSVRMRKSAGAF